MASKPECKYGAACYRTNPQHLKDFFHPSNDADCVDDGGDVTGESGTSTREEPRGVKRKDSNTSPPQLKRHNTRGGQKNTLDAFFGVKQKEQTGLKTAVVKQDSGRNGDQKCSDKGLETDNPVASYAGDASGSDDEKLCAIATEVEQTHLPSTSGPSQLLTCEEAKQKVMEVYMLELPEDFYQFWDFCKTLNSKNPALALKSVGLQLVGPYEIFTNMNVKAEDGASVHLHYRYYYDPPEFMTIITGDERQFHFGYFRDDPSEPPVFVASNSASENCLIAPRGENVFSAIKWYLEDKQKELTQSKAKILDPLCKFAKDQHICLELATPQMKQRQKKVVCKTFHGAGLVVPVDKNDVGYRPVPETPADLKRMLKKIVDSKTEDERNTYLEPLEEIITYVQFANDECDYGEGIELGLDLLSFGGEVLHPFISSLLCVGYRLLKRELYTDIVKAFLPLRSKSKPLTMFGKFMK